MNYKNKIFYLLILLLFVNGIVLLFMYNNYMGNNTIYYEYNLVLKANFDSFFKEKNESFIEDIKGFCLDNNLRVLFTNNAQDGVEIKFIYGDKNLLINKIKENKKLDVKETRNNLIIVSYKENVKNDLKNTAFKESKKTLEKRLKRSSIKVENNHQFNITFYSNDIFDDNLINELLEKSILSVHFSSHRDFYDYELMDINNLYNVKFKITKKQLFDYNDISKVMLDFSTKKTILKIKFKDKKRFENFSKQNRGKALSFVVDNKMIVQMPMPNMISNGIIQEIIGSKSEADTIFKYLNKKALPLEFDVVSKKTIDSNILIYKNCINFLIISLMFFVLEILTFIYYVKIK